MHKLDAAGLAAALPDRATAHATPAELLDVLEQEGDLEAALRLFAHCLPRREAVWWACMCARHTKPAELSEADRAAREATEAWVRNPEDVTRRTAFRFAGEAGFQTPEAWAAAAAFWSGESIAPAGLPVIAPPPHLVPVAVIGSVSLAATRGEGFDLVRRRRAFLQSGRDIAGGGGGWLPHEAAANEGGSDYVQRIH